MILNLLFFSQPPSTLFIPIMYSGSDSMSNHTTTTQIAQAPSSVVQPSVLLGKRHSVLTHSIQSLDGTSLFKKQKLAAHVNTRHMALYHPYSNHQQDRMAVSKI